MGMVQYFNKLNDDDNITVCTVVQNCCNGRSNKYRKMGRKPLTDWHKI